MKNYFSHDYNARNDRKLSTLLWKCQLDGLGAYWCIVEMLYEEGGYIATTEYERISYELRTSNELITKVIQDFDLFKIEDGMFFSESVNKRIALMKERSEKARASIKERWNKPRNTNVLRNGYERNTNKVNKSKIKENKLNEINKTTNVVEQVQNSEKAEYGNTEINKMLVALKIKIGIDAFVDSSIERNMARHCVSLMGKIGKDEFVRRLDKLLSDSFHSKNCNKIKYVYNNIKGFIEPKGNLAIL